MTPDRPAQRRAVALLLLLAALGGLGVITLGAAADVLAIGDGRNDLEMFAWAGRAVAMGQAVVEVREAADHVTAPVDEHGAAIELDTWFP